MTYISTLERQYNLPPALRSVLLLHFDIFLSFHFNFISCLYFLAPCLSLQEVNSMINKRLKDVLFTDQWSELCMDALSPFGYVLVSNVPFKHTHTHTHTELSLELQGSHYVTVTEWLWMKISLLVLRLMFLFSIS